MHIPLTTCSSKVKKIIEAATLIDSGTEGEFINWTFIHRNSIKSHKFNKPILIQNVDGMHNKNGRITQYCNLSFLVCGIYMQMHFLITSLGGEDAILGMSWLKKENPDIN
ncbi:hypothetical protein BDR06DRAFT_900364 [Suillus hirtellus]|nr:hypothetical protein BDR06DRAFT_900364 [Suillus hirtellus]